MQQAKANSEAEADFGSVAKFAILVATSIQLYYGNTMNGKLNPRLSSFIESLT